MDRIINLPARYEIIDAATGCGELIEEFPNLACAAKFGFIIDKTKGKNGVNYRFYNYPYVHVKPKNRA